MSKPTRILVCGGRSYDDVPRVYDVLDSYRYKAPHDALTIIQGGTSGADLIARRWCSDRGVPYDNFPADWKKHGKAAGPLRNQTMIERGNPDLVIAFPGGTGTADMVSRARSSRIKVIEVPASEAKG